MFNRLLTRKSRSPSSKTATESAPDYAPQDPSASSQSLHPAASTREAHALSRLSPSPSMSSLPSYRSRDQDLPQYAYSTGHPLTTLAILMEGAATAPAPRRPAPARRTTPPVDPALTLAPYSQPGSPWRDVSMSLGWIWMPRATKAYYRLIPHDHPVYSMSPNEQRRLRRMGIDPVAKAEFMILQR